MHFNTEFKELYNKKFCIYCGKEMKKKENYDYRERESTYYYRCYCKGAELEVDKQKELIKISAKYDEELSEFISDGKDVLSELIYKKETEKAKDILRYIKYIKNKGFKMSADNENLMRYSGDKRFHEELDREDIKKLLGDD